MMSVSQRDDGEMDEDMSPEEESDHKSEPPAIPDHKWECEHCTFVNKAGTRVCAVCCKTPTKKALPASLRRNSGPRGLKQDLKQDLLNKRNELVTKRTSSIKIGQDSEDEVATAFGKQLRLVQNESTKKGTIRKISFWPDTKFYSGN